MRQQVRTYLTTAVIFFVSISFNCWAFIGGTLNTRPLHISIIAFPDLYCTATKIAPKKYLTAAHCLANRGPFPIYQEGQNIELMIYNKNGKLESFHSRVFKIRIHESYFRAISLNYDPNIAASTAGVIDLAMVEITDESPIPSVIISKLSLKQNDFVIVGGFGCKNNYDDIITKFNQRKLSYYSATKNISTLSSGNIFTASAPELDANKKTKSTGCGGDSGGPVFRESNGILSMAGVNSFVDPNNKLNFVDLSNSEIRQWILK